jgi:hypothetical protein
MQIIVRDKRSEAERKKVETHGQILRHYYGREIRDGARIRLPASKKVIKNLYAQR